MRVLVVNDCISVNKIFCEGYPDPDTPMPSFSNWLWWVWIWGVRSWYLLVLVFWWRFKNAQGQKSPLISLFLPNQTFTLFSRPIFCTLISVSIFITGKISIFPFISNSYSDSYSHFNSVKTSAPPTPRTNPGAAPTSSGFSCIWSGRSGTPATCPRCLKFIQTCPRALLQGGGSRPNGVLQVFQIVVGFRSPPTKAEFDCYRGLSAAAEKIAKPLFLTHNTDIPNMCIHFQNIRNLDLSFSRLFI